MIIIVFLSIAILMPVLAYLLQPLANQKALVFLFTILFFGGFIFNFTSSHPFLGSWVNATESEAVSYAIKNDEELDDFLISRYLNNKRSKEDSFLLGTQIFYKSVELGSFTSAESILKIIQKSVGENFQPLIFNLLADLRDAKYPTVSNAKILLNIESPNNCQLNSLNFFASIPNGPGVNIASKQFESPDISKPLILDKDSGLVRGFDIPSAFLNQETIKIEAEAKCNKQLFRIFKSLDLGYSKNNQDELFFYANEWLKKEQ